MVETWSIAPPLFCCDDDMSGDGLGEVLIRSEGLPGGKDRLKAPRGAGQAGWRVALLARPKNRWVGLIPTHPRGKSKDQVRDGNLLARPRDWGVGYMQGALIC
jgi:hypothetical protein